MAALVIEGKGIPGEHRDHGVSRCDLRILTSIGAASDVSSASAIFGGRDEDRPADVESSGLWQAPTGLAARTATGRRGRCRPAGRSCGRRGVALLASSGRTSIGDSRTLCHASVDRPGNREIHDDRRDVLDELALIAPGRAWRWDDRRRRGEAGMQRRT